MDGYFLAVGEVLADVVSTNFCPSLQHAEGFNMIPGGSPANVAANIRFLGGRAKLVACVGQDSLGDLLVGALRAAGVDTTHVQVHKAEPTSIVLVTRSTGTPDFIAFRHADTCIRRLSSRLIAGSAVVHATAFALSLQPARRSILAAMKAAHDGGKLVSVDWNFAPRIWAGTRDAGDVFEKIISFSPLLKASVDDIERFAGMHLGIEGCKNFLERYTTTVTCLTCGKDGVWFRERNAAWQFMPAVAVAEVVDVTGAGDAFWAGFMVAFMEGAETAACVQHAAGIAAQKIAKHGPLYT